MSTARQESNSDYDVVIVGGGMVGTSLALQLASLSCDIKILIVESFPVKNSRQPGVQEEGASSSSYHSSFDARSTALSYGSKKIFEQLGIWPLLKNHVAPINAIHVSDRGKMGSAFLHKTDVDWSALGYVVENACLGEVLSSTVQKHNNINFCSPASVISIKPLKECVLVDIESDEKKLACSSQLAIIADGAASKLRADVGIDVKIRDYNQTAIIANVGFRHSVNNDIAFERFTDWGPMALLPLISNQGDQLRSALVWTMPPEKAQELMQVKNEIFLKVLQDRFGHRVGEFVKVGERFSFPLKLVEAVEQVRSRLVLMGNAAHSLHPVAGQGFNLALRDCSRLSNLLINAFERCQSIGHLSLLSSYQAQQQVDQQKTISFSDKVTSLFTTEQWPVSIFRGAGLGLMDVMPKTKEQFIIHAAGMHDGAAGANDSNRNNVGVIK